MIRLLNFAFIAITSLVCLGVYRVAEEARLDEAQLRATRAALIRESDALNVLGAEWARLTQPARIQALTERHLDLSDQPSVALSSLTDLPLKNAPAPEDAIRTAKAVVPQIAPAPTREPAPAPAPEAAPAPLPDVSFASLHTGT